MYDISKLLGWIVVWGFVFVMLNFLMKLINRTLISHISKDRKNIIYAYRFIMRFVIKLHKPVGVIISLIIIIHMSVMLIFYWISTTGLAALILMISVFLLGLYGAFIKKSPKGIWIKLHRGLAFALIIAISLHIFW